MLARKEELLKRARETVLELEDAYYNDELEDFIKGNDDAELTYAWDGCLIKVVLIKRFESCIVKIDTMRRAAIACCNGRSFGYSFDDNITYRLASAIDKETEKQFFNKAE